MNDNNSIYKAPASELLTVKPLPEEYLNGSLSRGKLKWAAWLSIFYMFLLIPTIGVSFLSGMDANNSLYNIADKIFSLLDLALWIYLMLILKTFMNYRFGFDGVNRYITILIFISVVMYCFTLFMKADMEMTGWANIVYFGLMLPYGIITILFGKKLLTIPDHFKHLKLFSWANILAGLCMASIVLFFLAIPLGLVSSLAMALMFFAAEKEIRGGNS